MRIGLREQEPEMTLPEPLLPKRRRQILDDETADTHRFDASKYEGSWKHEVLWADEDRWINSFMTRLAGLIRNMSGNR
jgi:hypothetical protein